MNTWSEILKFVDAIFVGQHVSLALAAQQTTLRLSNLGLDR